MNGSLQILKKELTRVFSDKRLVINLFILPAILLIGIYYFIGQMQSTMMDNIEKHVSNVYIQNAPEDFKDSLNNANYNANINFLEAGADLTYIKEGILEGTIDLLVAFEDNFSEKVSAYKDGGSIPEVKTFYNPSEDYSTSARSNFVDTVLNTYQQKLLKDRFGDVNQLTVFHVDLDPESSRIMDDQKASGKYFGTMLPYVITIMLFQGAMSLGIDAITGEKERGTMASMLLTPLKRKEIVIGKLISLCILTSLSAAIYAIAMIVAMPLMLSGYGSESMEALNLKFSGLQTLELLAILLVMVYLFVAIVALTSVIAKTAKEAGTYATPIYIIALVAGLATMFSGSEERTLGMYAIPVYGNALSIQKILVGELTLQQFGATISGTLLLAILLTALITKAFNSEKVMFNT